MGIAAQFLSSRRHVNIQASRGEVGTAPGESTRFFCVEIEGIQDLVQPFGRSFSDTLEKIEQTKQVTATACVFEDDLSQRGDDG